MDEVVDADIQQVEGPSEPCGVDNWDNQRAGEGTVLDGAGLVHEVVERYRETGQVGVVTDTWEAGCRHSGDFQVMEEGYMQDGEREPGIPFWSKAKWKQDEEGNTTYVGRGSGRDAHWCWTGARALLCRVGVAGGRRHLR